MTEGRFETTHNLRPKNWENRRHWTNWHHLYDCADDHMARESAPFHDLRAGGQFQYENEGAGPHAAPLEPQRVTERPAGDRMDFAPGDGNNMGGWGHLPLDTDPGAPTRANTIPRKTAVFTKKAPLRRGLFSEYPYMPEGAPVDAHDKNDERALAGSVKGPAARAGGMKTGGPGGYLGRPAEHIADPYNDAVVRGRIGRFKTGPVPHDDPLWMPDAPPDKPVIRPVGPFLAGKPNGFTLGGDQEWIPEPYTSGIIRDGRRPFRTWHTHTKWSMPVHAPWTTGLSTAEPKRGATFDLSQKNLPALDSYKRVSMQQTIGSEAALSTMRKPEPVRFK